MKCSNLFTDFENFSDKATKNARDPAEPLDLLQSDGRGREGIIEVGADNHGGIVEVPLPDVFVAENPVRIKGLQFFLNSHLGLQPRPLTVQS